MDNSVAACFTETMRKRSRKKPDVNEIAFAMVQDIAAGKIGQLADGKNPLAVALGRLGGLKGGKARAASLSAEERSAGARKAARARWEKKSDQTRRVGRSTERIRRQRGAT